MKAESKYASVYYQLHLKTSHLTSGSLKLNCTQKKESNFRSSHQAAKRPHTGKMIIKI